ncbi:hypothetical protein J27TS7_28950 [Paenibacillus dendritiformis]|nr:hypothetical protein J27TS7_28950 [Paenibacillus dendritiformis]
MQTEAERTARAAEVVRRMADRVQEARVRHGRNRNQEKQHRYKERGRLVSGSFFAFLFLIGSSPSRFPPHN